MSRKPLIGCTTYHIIAGQDPPLALFGLMPAYVEAIVTAGGIPCLIPHRLDEADMSALLEQMDGLLLPGGGDVEPSRYNGRLDETIWGIDGERDRIELFLTRAAVTSNKPLLAICRGCQVFNVAMGGTLWGDVASQMPAALKHNYYRSHPRNYLGHTVAIDADSRLYQVIGQPTTWVNSLHHQGIRDLAAGLVATAVAPDGLIEAIEVRDHRFAVGVQWHPENLIHDDPKMLALFKELVAAAVGE
jgi:putative glutamine amidotransferase